MQAVRVSVPATELAALEAHVAVVAPQHREPLRLEQDALGRPGGGVARKLGGHKDQRPPRQRATGHWKRGTRQRRVVQIGLEEFWSHSGRPVQGCEPTLMLY